MSRKGTELDSLELELRTVFLIPTPFERSLLADSQLVWCHENRVALEVIGFGPVLAAARTSQILSEMPGLEVYLIGIAGKYPHRDDLEIGEAYCFNSVQQYGVGVGDGDEHESATSLGWGMFLTKEGGSISEVIEFNDDLPAALSHHRCDGKLVTVPTASRNPKSCMIKSSRVPDAAAEDMEGYGVAVASRLHGRKVKIVRGLSNVAGERDKSTWECESAMRAAFRLASQWCSHQDFSEENEDSK